MKLELSYKGQISLLDFFGDVLIGKSKECDVQLKGWTVAAKHAKLIEMPAGIVIQDLDRGANGTIVNGKKIDYYGPIVVGTDLLEISGYKIRVLHADVDGVETLASTQPTSSASRYSPPSKHQDIDLQRPIIEGSTQLSVYAEPRKSINTLQSEWMSKLHTLLLERMDLRRKDVAKMTDAELKEETTVCLDQLTNPVPLDFPKELDIYRIKKLVLDEAIGLGALEDLLSDVRVSEIMVNAFDEIYIEKDGQIQKSESTFSSNRSVLDVIERIVAPLGRRIDESSPMVDARLKDGSRVNAIIPPLAIKGPTITIRKFPAKRLDIRGLVEYYSLSPDMASFLEMCVLYKKNIIISGGTGSGKTTLLNVLSNFIPNDERVITIEDAAELQLNSEHLINLEARPGNSEGKGHVSIRDLVKNSLRMRPDRIVIGECRGAETLDMLSAMNTGHEGSLSTLHSNTPRDALSRMETMIMMAGMDLPLSAIREQIASAVDIIVQQTRFSCGSRKVTYITEITGMESGKIQMQDIFLYKKTGIHPETFKVQGQFTPCDSIPAFYDELRASGIELPIDIFKKVDS